MFPSLFSFFCGILLFALIWIVPPNSAWAMSNSLTIYPPFAAIFNFEGQIPKNLGIHKGKLSPCSSAPNCVVSQESDQTHQIKPISYQTDRKTAQETLLKVLSVVPGSKIVEETENYIHVEFRSKLMGFVDDGEFYFPPEEKVIHLRSAARLGESDLGVNRRRLEQIRLAMDDL
jgi:uncharacterized protein (DUF1499 family)